GKGGGIAGAFGGAAAETFGVKAGSVNRFTALLATIFCALALLHAGLSSTIQGASVIPAAAPEVPAVPVTPAPETPAMGEAPTPAPAAAPYGSVTGLAGADREFLRLTAYAGRRNREYAHVLTPSERSNDPSRGR